MLTGKFAMPVQPMAVKALQSDPVMQKAGDDRDTQFAVERRMHR